MKILKYFETLWKIAIALALCTAIYNIIRFKTFDYHVYLPLVCAIMSFVLWRNLQGQRKFMDKMREKIDAEEQAQAEAAESTENKEEEAS